jgi:ATP-dependent Clp protease ATP-binding subunit ClpC
VFERFDDHAKAAMLVAQEAARSLGHRELGTEHLAIALAHEGYVSGSLLARLGASSSAVTEAVVRAAPAGTEGLLRHLPLDPHAKRALLAAADEAGRGEARVGTEHLLLGLVRERKSPGARVLRGLGVDERAVRAALADRG